MKAIAEPRIVARRIQRPRPAGMSDPSLFAIIASSNGSIQTTHHWHRYSPRIYGRVRHPRRRAVIRQARQVAGAPGAGAPLRRAEDGAARRADGRRARPRAAARSVDGDRLLAAVDAAASLRVRPGGAEAALPRARRARPEQRRQRAELFLELFRQP